MGTGELTLEGDRLRSVVMDNGLTVMLREVHTAPLASVWCWYRVGSSDEAPGFTGVSHWVEHMNFKGTRNIPREQMKRLVERFGGTWNGYTWIDQTTYFQTASKDALDQMLFIEAERMANGLYEPEECESERTVIISELQGGENDPEQLLDVEVTATAIKSHPYRHPTIGWLDDLETMTREDLYSHYRRYYVPNNAVLVVVGDIDPDAALRQVDQRFTAIPPGSLPRRRHTREAEQLGERRVTITRPGTTAYLKLAYHAPAVMGRDFLPLLVLDAVLSGAKGLNLWSSFRGVPPQRRARLYRALVERRLASTVSGALLPTQDPFLYTISATANDGVPLATLEQATIEELDRVRTGGVTPDEMARAKRQLRARAVFEDDSVTNIAHQIGFFETIGSSPVYASLAERIDAVTLEEVGLAARTCLAPANRTVGWFQPLPAPAPPDSEQSAGLTDRSERR